jgi:hypothetical protein
MPGVRHSGTRTGTKRDSGRDSYWDSLARSETRSGLGGQLQGGNQAEEEGPTLRKISALQGAGKAKEEGLLSFSLFFFTLFFSMHT